MKNLRSCSWMIVLLAVMISGCKSGSGPDVSNIKVDLQIQRFDQFMFTQMDTANIAAGATSLQATFPAFSNDFITRILGLPGLQPGIPDSARAFTMSELKRFITLTTPLYDSLSAQYKEVDDTREALTRSFKHVKYYYPAYTVPRIIYYLGPFDAPGVAITTDALAVGIQLFAGKDFSFYQTPQGLDMFPAYISRNFEKENIPVSAMKAVVEDIYPDKSIGRPLVEQMIEKGKSWFMVRRFMPGVADSVLTGYMGRQVRWCQENEASIWNYFLQGNELYNTEPMIVKNYIGESPNTQGMPDAAPGNIGQWVGLQILEQFAKKNPALKPDQILAVDAKKIFSEAKYRPR